MNSDDKQFTYGAAKKYAELAVWEWAEAHPDVDVTTSKIDYISYHSSPLKTCLEQYSHLTSTVHSHPSFFHFRSLIMTPFPLPS